MNDTVNIAVLVGTTRPKRKSLFAAQFVASIGKKIDGVNITFVDPKSLQLLDDGNSEENRDPVYTNITRNADAFFIVTPEYNHSYPGSLKRMLDSEYENYYRKPVAMAGVSSGMFGGARALQSLLAPLRKMGMFVINSDVYFQYSNDLFSERGEISNDKKEFYTDAINKSYNDLIWLAKALKSAKQNNS